MRWLQASGSNPTLMSAVSADHCTTGLLMTLACASISARALAASMTPAWVAASSLRQVVPLRLTRGSQPAAFCQAGSRSAGTPCFLKSWNWWSCPSRTAYPPI